MTITPPRPVRVSVAILLATTVGLLAVACTSKAGAGPAKSAVPTKTTEGPETVPPLDAVSISDAVLFDQGPAARYLAKLNQPPVTMTDDMTAVRTDIDAKLAADGAFAQSYVARMQSGDPVQVQSALEDEAKLYVRPALVARFGTSTVDGALGDGTGLFRQTRVYIFVIAWNDIPPFNPNVEDWQLNRDTTNKMVAGVLHAGAPVE